MLVKPLIIADLDPDRTFHRTFHGPVDGRPPYLAPLVLYLNPMLQGCYQVLKRCEIG